MYHFIILCIILNEKKKKKKKKKKAKMAQYNYVWSFIIPIYKGFIKKLMNYKINNS